MPDYWISLLGLLAAIFTSLSYIPQLAKAWPRGETKDISLGMLFVLICGLLLWVGYGIAKSDWVIAIANTVGVSLVGAVLGCKIRDLRQ